MAVRKATVNRVVKGLTKGQSLRQIGAKLGLESKAVWRIGAKEGVFSVRARNY